MKYRENHRKIVEACKQGNRSAQFQLYQLYAKAMYNICLRMMGNQEDAEDILQNSFMDVFSKLHYFRFESAIGAWIKRIVVNNCINALKKKRVKLVEMGDRDVADLLPTYANLEDTKLTVLKIKQALEQLPEGYRVVFSLYLLEGYDHQEISEVLGISPSTSKSQYSRAKKKIKAILKKNEEQVIGQRPNRMSD